MSGRSQMERETHRDRETRGGAGRQPGPAAPAPALSGEGSAEPRQTGRFGRGSCSPRGRPKDQRGELEVYAPLLTPRGPVDGTVEPRALPHPSPPHLCWGPRCPRVLRPAARGGSVHTRTQPALPAACCEAVGPPRAAAGAAAAKPSPAHAASASGPFRPVSDCRASVTASLAGRPAGPLWTPAPGPSFALLLSLFEVVLVIPRLRTSTRFRISVLSSTFQKPRESSQGSGVTHRSVSGDAASWRWGPPAAGAAGSPFFGSSPVRAGRFGFSGRKSSTVLARRRVC